MDLKAEAKRLAEECWRKQEVETYDVSTDIAAIESALLAFGRLVREEDAKVCERIGSLLATRDVDYKKLYGHPLEARGIHIIHDAACSRCAEALRAKALE